MDLTMLKKFEIKTNRVKGLSFHPHRPWILVALHNGAIQLYDYRMEILIDSFEEHDGPVRSVDFHKTQPLFVSGGDDYKIKVWNYQMRRCLYTLHGHLDYIRTVQFHPGEQPWILSASDDQTVRIWNWQSRSSLVVLTGHNHYVMCAQWHPTEDLILSASLDQTIRIWDISGLKKRSTSVVEESNVAKPNNDVFGNVDAVVKFVLEGHSRGVNWASFHPSMSLVVSGADDREIKVWRMSGSRAWETTTYRGHLNNVSCVLFHPKENVIISNSEDKTLRIWDVSRNYAPLSFRRDNDRYWILVAHPRLNLLAAGHDGGMVVFKLSRERPAFDISLNSETVLFYYDGSVRNYDYNKDQTSVLFQTKVLTSNSASNKRPKKPRKILSNPYSSVSTHNILLWFDGDEREYELYSVDKKKGADISGSRTVGNSVAFVTRNRFAVLAQNGEILLKNMDNQSKKKMKIQDKNINYLFTGGPGRVLARSVEWMTLFDVASRKVVNELQIQSRFPVKAVYWSHDFEKCALLSRFSVMICDDEVNEICTIYENAKVKSGQWSKDHVFIYTTVTHMKYALPSGDHGIIKTLDEVLYVARIKDDTVLCMNRESQITKVVIDDTEYLFKKALSERKYNVVQHLIESGKLRGESIIGYLQKKGFPEVAMRFVKDTTTRFELALECGNIDDAFECARQINTEKCWERFGNSALMQGNYQFVTEAYKQTRNFEKLMYLFLLTGDFPMLEKLSGIAKQKDDKIMRYHISLFNGNVQERISALSDSGQYGLAYLTAMSYGLNDVAAQMKEKLGDKNVILPQMNETQGLRTPPHPIFGPFTEQNKYDWPRTEIIKGFFDKQDIPVQTQQEETNKKIKNKEKAATDLLESDEEAIDETKEDIDFGFSNEKSSKKKDKGKEQEEVDLAKSGWDSGDDLVVSDDENEKGKPNDDTFEKKDDGLNKVSYFMMPRSGESITKKWLESAICPADMICAGSFELAQEALHRQFCIVNFAPLKPYFLQLYLTASIETPLFANTPDLTVGLRRDPKSNKIAPLLSLSLKQCKTIINDAYLCVTKSEFETAVEMFRKVLHILPLLVITSNEELREGRQMIVTCREYINALRVKLESNNIIDEVRKFEMSCYFTHFTLQDAHIFSGLYGAIKLGYRMQNYDTTAILCRRLLELVVLGKVRTESSKTHVEQVDKVLKKCESKKGDKDTLAYKPHDFTTICAMSLKPIQRTDKSVKSPYCGSTFLAEYDGQLSPVCQLVRIGGSAQGLTIYST